MVQLIEVYELNRANAQSTQNYTLREIYINPKHVISLREDDNIKRKLNEGILPDGLNNSHCFTRMMLDKGQTGVELIIVGSPHTIQEKIKEQNSELLLG